MTSHCEGDRMLRDIIAADKIYISTGITLAERDTFETVAEKEMQEPIYRLAHTCVATG